MNVRMKTRRPWPSGALPKHRWRAARPGAAPLQAFADIVKVDVAVWAKVVKEAGITAD